MTQAEDIAAIRKMMEYFLEERLKKNQHGDKKQISDVIDK